MELTIFVAKVFALYLLAVGIGILSGKLKMSKMMDDFEKSSGLMFMTGFVLLVLGGLLVQHHNIWVKDWPVLVTIIGWATLVKGFLFIVYPQAFFSFKGMYKNMGTSFGIFPLILSLVLGYFLFLT